jgi:hypothetical protein
MKNNRKKMIVLLFVAMAIILLIAAFFDGFGRYYKNDLVVTSPDGNHQLLIREWETLGGTGAEIYATNPHLPMFLSRLIKMKVGNTVSDERCCSFSEGRYDIVWEENCAVIYYFSGIGKEDFKDRSTWSVVRCELP